MPFSRSAREGEACPGIGGNLLDWTGSHCLWLNSSMGPKQLPYHLPSLLFCCGGRQVLQAMLLRAVVMDCFAILARAAFQAAESSIAPAALVEQLRAAAPPLLDLSPNNAERFLRGQLMQPAAELAALMRQYYALPAVAAERQLALAKAAAGRSCAYLRCANLSGEGGPAAGQGVGSMRCRWVRRVRRQMVGTGSRAQICSLEALLLLLLLLPLLHRMRHPLHPPPHGNSPPPLPLLLCAAPVARCGTAAPLARTPTGGRAGTAACARRWARRGGRRKRRRQGNRIKLNACKSTRILLGQFMSSLVDVCISRECSISSTRVTRGDGSGRQRQHSRVGIGLLRHTISVLTIQITAF